MARCTIVLLLAAMLATATPPAVWIDVPFVRQPRDGCGAASVSMVMEYWAQEEHRASYGAERVQSIQQRIYSPRLHGATPEAMEDYLRGHGFLAFAISGTWQVLDQEIGKGRPLIVALRPRGQRELHYVVIAGVDPARGLVTMNDPAQRKLLTQERAGFERDWSATHNWMLLAVPKPERH